MALLTVAALGFTPHPGPHLHSVEGRLRAVLTPFRISRGNPEPRAPGLAEDNGTHVYWDVSGLCPTQAGPPVCVPRRDGRDLGWKTAP